jgi:signal transduction histidine kinase
MSEHDEWNAVLGHELRSPLAAILGYQELLEDGTLGDLSPAAGDAVRRIRFAATHLRLLIDAMDEPGADDDAPTAIPASVIIADAIHVVRFDAEGRGTGITTGSLDPMLMTHRDHACRALALALGAAVKVSPGNTIDVSAHDGPSPVIALVGSALQPDRDSLQPGRPLTGAGLRLHLGAAAARRAGGRLDLDPSGAVHLVLPPVTSA